MGWRRKVRFPARLPATDAEFARMAAFPSYRAPTAREVLTSRGDQTSGTSVADVFARWSAEDVTYENGVPVGLSLSGRAFIAGGPAVFAVAPVRTVRLVAVQPFMPELATCPHLANLDCLDLTGNRIGPDGMLRLLASPYLAGLRELHLERNDIGDAGADALLMADLPSLARLVLTPDELSPERLTAIVARFGTITRP